VVVLGDGRIGRRGTNVYRYDYWISRGLPQALVLFLSLAAGALLYAIDEMFAVGRRFQQPLWAACGLVIGFLIAYGTDLILTIAGV